MRFEGRLMALPGWDRPLWSQLQFFQLLVYDSEHSSRLVAHMEAQPHGQSRQCGHP